MSTGDTSMPTETLLQKQFRFMRMVPRLLDKAHEMGFEVTEGDAFRDPRVHGAVGVKMGYGHPKSCHKIRLAIDLNLFRDGKFLDSSEVHKPLGEWWESQGGSWGGRFDDGNHYSLEYKGMR
jgi:hypothetical protein